MDSIFAEIEQYPANQNGWTTAPQSIGLRPRGATTYRSSTADLGDAVAPPNASIGDEQAAEQQRQQDVRRRIVELEALFFEDYDMPLHASSRSAFECFMKYCPMAGMPLLGAEPGGTLIATWIKGFECLSLRFSDRFHLDFAVTYRQGHDDVRRWGKSSLGSVFSECPQAKRLVSN